MTVVSVTMGDISIDLVPHVREAVHGLGYIRADAINWFAARLEEHFDKGKLGYEIRRSGRELSKESKITLGLAGIRISLDAWNALSAKGRTNPVAAFDTTATRVVHNVYRARNHQQRLRSSNWLSRSRPWARLMTHPQHICSGVQKYAGKAIPLQEIFELPISSCQLEWCACNWQTLSDRDLQRYGVVPLAATLHRALSDTGTHTLPQSSSEEATTTSSIPNSHRLVGMFLDKVWPATGNPAVRQASMEEIVELLLSAAKPFHDEALRMGMQWSPSGVMEVDQLLERIARDGIYDLAVKLSPDGVTEWWRRWSYALSAAQLELTMKTGFTIPLPIGASDEVNGMAVTLYMIAGIGRDYPPSWAK